MSHFSDRANTLTSTAAQVARLKGATAEAQVLEQAKASLVEMGHDNWDGGIDLYTLMLEVPVPTYVAIDDERDALEQAILKRMTALIRGAVGNAITEVVISPILSDEARPTEAGLVKAHPPEGAEPPGFWEPGFFRIFISHESTFKGSAHRLKEAFANYRVAAFVAHDDIEPTKEWQAEIERALRTMDAMVAIVSPEFRRSQWCDQEVGIAVGRGKLVIPLCVEAVPHGFLGKHQGMQAKGLKAPKIAERLVDVLVSNTLSFQRMSEALVESLATSRSWDRSKDTISLLEKVPRLNSSQVARLVRAIDENVEVKHATNVPERIRALIARRGDG